MFLRTLLLRGRVTGAGKTDAATAKPKTKKYNVVGSRLFDPHIGVDQSLYCDHLRILMENTHVQSVPVHAKAATNPIGSASYT